MYYVEEMSVVAARIKTFSNFTTDGDRNKISKRHQKVCHKTENLILKIIETFQKPLKNEINLLETDIEVDSSRENHKDFIKSKRIILRLQQRS